MVEHPDDLRAALIRILESRNTDFDVAIAASEVVASDARFNRWVATIAKRPGSTVDMVALVEQYGDLIDQCTMAWARFLADENAAPLLATLQAIDGKLSELVQP